MQDNRCPAILRIDMMKATDLFRVFGFRIVILCSYKDDKNGN